MAIWDAITKPIRGLGRILRGKFKQGLGDIGSGAKSAAPLLALTGVGAPLALAIGAAGGALEGGTTGGGGIGNVLKGAAGGAARTGLALGARGLGSKLMGGGGAAEGVPNLASAGTGSQSASSALQAISQRGGLSKLSEGAGRSLGSRLLGGAGDAISYAEKHPTLVGSALKGYGDYRQGQADDRALDFEREQVERTNERQENMDPIIADILKRLLSENRAAA